MIGSFLLGAAIGVLIGAALIGFAAIVSVAKETFASEPEAEEVYTIKKKTLHGIVKRDRRLRNLADALTAGAEITGAHIAFDRYGSPLSYQTITCDFENEVSENSYYCRRSNPDEVYVGRY